MIRTYGTLPLLFHFLPGLKSGLAKSAEPMVLKKSSRTIVISG